MKVTNFDLKNSPVHLSKISVLNFKNYEGADLDLCSHINCFVGDNGSGKTNMLDAVHYLSLCKSYFNPIDRQNIRHEAPFFVIQGTFNHEDQEDEVYCGLKRGQKKIFKRNQKEYNRLADHIGRFPAVVISPYDADLIRDGSEIRRKFIDSIISQFDKLYLDDLIRYNKALNQRNRLLRAFFLNRMWEEESLQIWDDQLVNYGNKLFEKRKLFIEKFTPGFNNAYKQISGKQEEVSLDYHSPLLEKGFDDILKSNREKDKSLQRTSSGTHRDDLLFKIEGYPLKKFGSQGQQKSFLIALKLAQFTYIAEQTGKKPLLLLDDVFDKIDDKRVNHLMKLVTQKTFGQIFISDTHEDRIPLLFKDVEVPLKVFRVSEGEVKESYHLESEEHA